jgi:hypothetical protein
MDVSPGIAARLVLSHQPRSGVQPAAQEAPQAAVQVGFETGRQLAARVLQVLADGRFLIEVQGTELLARSSVALRAGQSFMVEVAGQEPLLTLRLLLPAAELDAAEMRHAALLLASRLNVFAARLGGLMELLGDRQAIAFDALRQAAALFRPAPLLAALREGRASFVSRLGLDWEARLAAAAAAGRTPVLPAPAEQLKAALLETLKWLRHVDEAPEFIRTTTASVRELLGLVECNQYLNNAGIRGFDGLFLILPLWGEGLETDLWIRFQREGGDGGAGAEEGHSLHFVLELPEFGRVASYVALVPRRVTIDLRVTGEGQRQVLEPLLAESRERLAARLQREVLIGVRVDPGVPVAWQREVLGRLPAMVDLKV